MRRRGFKNVCVCGFTRDCMQQVQKKYFPSSPMKLQLLAACAVPTEAIYEATIHTEGLIRLDNSARCIQRQWRSYLQARGPGYRTRICKFYMRQGCRRGVHCTFAHGSHDVRENFDHSNHDVPEKNTSPSPIDDDIYDLRSFQLACCILVRRWWFGGPTSSKIQYISICILVVIEHLFLNSTWVRSFLLLFAHCT